MMIRLQPLLWALALQFSTLSCQAEQPQSREQLIAETLTEKFPAREVVWLGNEDKPFIGLYKYQADYTTRGAVLIIHSMAGHPDWPEVIAPLRTLLPRTGWATLAIQMPVLAPGEPLADYGKTLAETRQRISTSIQYLQKAGFRHIVIVGHSFGAATAADYLTAKDYQPADAFISISMLAQAFLKPRLRILQKIKAITVPTLDLYGSQDFTEVLRMVDDRRLAGKQNTSRLYQQYELGQANHYFSGQEPLLANRISNWLDTVLPEAEIPGSTAAP